MIKIITVYNSLNPGSLLQAIALYETLEKKYKDVSFLVTNIRHPYLSGIKLFLKLLFKLKIKRAFSQLFMPIKYNKILNNYKRTKIIEKNDIYIIGSDEIWNISRPQMLKYKILWGEGINKNRAISYAPSINNTKVEELKNHSFIIDSLNRLHKISVRDNHSKDCIEQLTNRKIELVCDPTMLLDVKEFRNKEENINIKNYILIYGPESFFTEDAVEEIKKFAKENNKTLISYYFNHNWCEKHFYGSAYEFLGLVSKAEYVFTGTFHGSIFSIIYNKKFVVFGENNKKVQEVLDQFDLKNRFSSGMKIEDILCKDYEYDKINKKILDLKIKSEEYLYDSINDIFS